MQGSQVPNDATDGPSLMVRRDLHAARIAAESTQRHGASWGRTSTLVREAILKGNLLRAAARVGWVAACQTDGQEQHDGN